MTDPQIRIEDILEELSRQIAALAQELAITKATNAALVRERGKHD